MRGMLEGFDTKNVFVNTVLLETQSVDPGGLEIRIDAEGAAREMRALSGPRSAGDSSSGTDEPAEVIPDSQRIGDERVLAALRGWASRGILRCG